MPLKDMATSTAAFVLIRSIGGTVGISVGQVIISSVSAPCARYERTSLTETVQELRRRVANIPNVNIDTSPSALTQAVRQIPKLSVRTVPPYPSCPPCSWLICYARQDVAERVALTHAYTRSIATIWLVMTPILGVGFISGMP